VRIHASARRHGVADGDTLHAIRNCILARRVDENQSRPRLLLVGPDRAGNALEVIVVNFDSDDAVVIHAMRMRPKYFDLMGRHER
jgi:hypothetical protein